MCLIPRDSKIELDGYKARKANAYYARFYSVAKSDGLDKKSAERKAKQDIRKMFGEFFDIPLNYTATINFQGFADVVDALGGIDVDVDMDMHYVDNADGTNINLTKGHQKLNGDKMPLISCGTVSLMTERTCPVTLTAINGKVKF